MKLVVTGALGHIGSRYIRFLQAGVWDEVVLIDNLATQRYCSLFDLPAGIPFRFVEADVCAAAIEPLFESADVVVHLAAITNAAGSFEIQKEVEEVNLHGTERVAQLCSKVGARLVFLSTTSVYGSQDALVDEDCPAEQLKPQSPYAESKLRAEEHLHELGASAALRFVTFRFGTIFGPSPGMRFHTAINKFIWQAVMGLPLTVWRTALHQKRPYLDLDDAVSAIDFVVSRDHFDNRLYNVVTLNATVARIVEVIREALGREVEVAMVDSRIMNQLSYEVASTRFEALGFQPHGDLRSAVSHTIEILRAACSKASRSTVAG